MLTLASPTGTERTHNVDFAVRMFSTSQDFDSWSSSDSLITQCSRMVITRSLDKHVRSVSSTVICCKRMHLESIYYKVCLSSLQIDCLQAQMKHKSGIPTLRVNRYLNQGSESKNNEFRNWENRDILEAIINSFGKRKAQRDHWSNCNIVQDFYIRRRKCK